MVSTSSGLDSVRSFRVEATRYNRNFPNPFSTNTILSPTDNRFKWIDSLGVLAQLVADGPTLNEPHIVWMRPTLTPG
jgi:hypothetical protein